jgi:hypothetical protein
VIPDDRNLLDDVLAHARHFREEEEGEDPGGGAEKACCGRAALILLANHPFLSPEQ